MFNLIKHNKEVIFGIAALLVFTFSIFKLYSQTTFANDPAKGGILDGVINKQNKVNLIYAEDSQRFIDQINDFIKDKEIISIDYEKSRRAKYTALIWFKE